MADWATKKLALEEALASGELTVEADGDRVTYRSMSDLLKALDYADRQLIAESGSSAVRPATTVAYYDPR